MARVSRLPQRILIVRPTALGDVCRTVPALVTLKRAMPEARIDWLVHDGFADAVRHHPDLHQVIPFPRRHLATAWRSPGRAADAVTWARQLERTCYDMVFDLQGLLRSGLITYLTRARRRVGFRNAREMAWAFYNVRHPIDPHLHTVDRMLQLLAADGHKPVHDLRLYLGPDDQRWLEQCLAQQQLEPHNYICFAPTAKWLCKCWPVQRYLDIGRRLLAGGHASKLVTLASPSELPQLKPLLDGLAPHVVCPTTTVGQAMALISQCRLLICNDSAPLHMAVGFDRPIVALFGPTDPALVGPYQRDDCVLRPAHLTPHDVLHYRHHPQDQQLISRLEVDQVWDRVQQLLRLTAPVATGSRSESNPSS